MFNAQGQFIEKSPSQSPSSPPVYAAKNRAFPVGASEWQERGNEEYGSVGNTPHFIVNGDVALQNGMPAYGSVDRGITNKFRDATEQENKARESPGWVSHPSPASNRGCLYSAQGQLQCPK